MRRLPAGLVVLLVLGWPVTASATVAQHERILFVQGGGHTHLRSVAPGGGPGQRLTDPAFGIMSPDWSPDGTQIAFVSSAGGSPDVYVMNADGSGIRPFAAGRRGEGHPAWSPDGEQIAYTIENRLYVRRIDDGTTRLLDAAGVAIFAASWSPDGKRIVYSVDRADETAHLRVIAASGGRPRPLTSGNVRDVDPAWSPGGRFIAFVRHEDRSSLLGQLWLMAADGSGLRPLLADAESHAAPAWSPSGGRIAFSRGLDAAAELYTVALDGTRLRRLTANAVADGEPEWAEVPASRARLPDFDQRAPRGLAVRSRNGRFKLGFTSATDNIGLGPIWIRGVRNGLRRAMDARQIVRFADGVYVLPRTGTMRFTAADSHRHWHLLRFQSYELRRARDFGVVVRDRKSGFCLLDRWGRALKRIPWRPPPRFTGNCAERRPTARRVEHGTSAGYTDLYPAHFHGQNLDVTGVRAGRYWLVHRANASGQLRELNYENNAAAVLIRLRWPNGRRSAPQVRILRACPRAERC